MEEAWRNFDDYIMDSDFDVVETHELMDVTGDIYQHMDDTPYDRDISQGFTRGLHKRKKVGSVLSSSP